MPQYGEHTSLEVKEPLPLFFVDLAPDERAKEIYEVTHQQLHMRVKIESSKQKKVVVLCHRCQQLGHIKTYCTRTPVCVKCGEERTWSECKKTGEAEPTFGLCGGDHTANYRGSPEVKKSTVTRPATAEKLPKSWHTTTTDPSKSSADVAAQRSTDSSSSPTGKNTTPSRTEFSELLSCFERLEQLMADMVRQNSLILELLV